MHFPSNSSLNDHCHSCQSGLEFSDSNGSQISPALSGMRGVVSTVKSTRKKNNEKDIPEE